MTKFIKIIIFISAIVFSTFSASSQMSRNFNQFEFRGDYGFTLPVHSYVDYYLQHNISGGSILYSVKTDGGSQWSHIWRFPEWGAGLSMNSLGNINTFGFASSLYAFVGIPIIESEHLTFKYRMGAGVSYISEKYDARNNYYNIVVGSHVNALLHFSLMLDYKPTSFPMYISAGLSYNHYSNWNIKRPNDGISHLTFNLGLKYMYSEYVYSLPKRQVPYLYNKELEISGYYSAAVKQVDYRDSKFYLCNSLFVDAAVRINKQRSLGGGISVLFDNSLKTLCDTAYKNVGDMFRVGLHLFQEVYLLERLSVPVELGAYLYNPYSGDGKFLMYCKFGLRYEFVNHVFVNLMYKTHYFKAEALEYGVGVKF